MATDTERRWLEGIANQQDRWSIQHLVEPLGDRYSSQPLTSAGLVIHGSGSTLAKTGTANFYAVANGVLVTIAASTDMPALVGSITAGSYNVFCFFIDSAASVTVAMGTEGTALAKVGFPQFPKNQALVGFLIVTYASAFVGGTTALDTATTVYVSPLGAFDPTVLTG